MRSLAGLPIEWLVVGCFLDTDGQQYQQMKRANEQAK